MNSRDLDERLRAALSARAELVTADSLRPREPISTRPVRVQPRVGRLVLSLAASLTVLVVLGIVFYGVTIRRADGGQPAHPTTASPSATGGPRVALDGVTFEVPAGWSYHPVAEGIGCVQAGGVPTVDSVCTPAGVQIQVGSFVGWPKNALDRDDGWSGAWKNCRAAGYAYPMDEPKTQRLVSRDTRLVGDGTGAYRVWRARCGSDAEFAARLWWRPDVSLAVFSVRLDPKNDAVVDRFVASIRANANPGR